MKPPATHATYDTPALPPGMPSGPGTHGRSFAKAARGIGQDDALLVPRSTPGPGQYNPRYAKRDKAVPVAKLLGKPVDENEYHEARAAVLQVDPNWERVEKAISQRVLTA